MTRDEYMAALAAAKDDAEQVAVFEAYYDQFVGSYAVAVVLARIGKARIDASTDIHFNDIPLKEWDAMAPCVERGGFSLSDCVCVLKQAARHIKSLKE